MKRYPKLLLIIFLLFSCVAGIGNLEKSFAENRNLIKNYGFEGKNKGIISGWESRNGAKIEAVSEEFHNGNYSLKVTERPKHYSGVQMDLKYRMRKNKTYQISAWVKLPAGTPDCTMNLQFEAKYDGLVKYPVIKSTTVSAERWTQLTGQYKVSYSQSLDALLLYVASGDGNLNSFYVDDFEVFETEPQAAPQAPSNPIPVNELPNKPNPVVESDATINWYDTKQTIDGFGVSEAFKANALMQFAKRDQVIDLLFSEEKGIGLNILRNEIIGNISLDKGRYDWAADSAQVALSKEVGKRGDIKFVASAWSPPAWMKDNKNNIKGSLAPAHYQDYAEFLATYVMEYKKRYGIDYYAISPANEPNLEPDYSGCKWTGPQIRDFIKNNIKPTFEKYDIQTKFMAAEDSNFSEKMMIDSLKDPQAASRVDIVAAHGYGNSTAPMPLASSMGKPIWMTEVMSYYDYDISIRDGLLWAKRIHKHMTRAGVNAWFYWWGAYNTATSNSGLIYIDADKKEYELKKRLWTIGNYSKFVRPGYQRVSATREPNKDVFVTAFKDDTAKKLIIVVVNSNLNQQTVNLKLNGLDATTVKAYRTSEKEDLAAVGDFKTNNNTVKAQLPPQSVTTYVITGTPGKAEPAEPEISSEDMFILAKFKAIKATPVIDGEIDASWEKANSVTTSITGEGSFSTEGARAKVRAMWDEKYLYILAEVADPQVTKQSSTVYIQDSFEMFLDENHGRTTSYEVDDAQYRVNPDNEISYGGNCDKARFVVKAKKVKDGYLIEAAIPFQQIKPVSGTVVGAEFQVNDEVSAKTRSITKWASSSGDSYKDTSMFGEIELVEK